MAASNPSKYPVLPPTNNIPRVIRKRVGGGFKYVVEMTEEKDSREKGKEEVKYLEKAEEEYRGEVRGHVALKAPKSDDKFHVCKIEKKKQTEKPVFSKTTH